MNETETGIINYKVSRTNTMKARAFTMLELLLVIMIIMILGAVIWPSITNRTSGANLKFVAEKLAALLQMARSQAMITGNCHRCRFELDGMQAVIEEESDPVAHPGVFEKIKTHWAVVDLGKDEIKCLAVQFDPWETILRQQEASVLETGQDNNTATDLLCPPIAFYPNGSGDSASILLGNNEDKNFTIKLNGLTGQVLVEQGNKLDDNQTNNELRP
ncbi:MAG: GspH/FimT family pseudopilin [Phycisphaerae bacterium]